MKVKEGFKKVKGAIKRHKKATIICITTLLAGTGLMLYNKGVIDGEDYVNKNIDDFLDNFKDHNPEAYNELDNYVDIYNNEKEKEYAEACGYKELDDYYKETES